MMKELYMNALVLIPTYNERETIEALLRDLFSLPVDGLHVMVIDDSSPDGTTDVVRSLQGMYPRLHLLVRSSKQGLGRAYVDGFREALRMNAPFILTMDADGSHDPFAIPAFLQRVTQSDLVLGSRYIPGGRIQNWNAIRRFVSWLGNVYARTVLGLSIRDMTTGFRCYRRSALESIDLSSIDALGYAFQIEMVYKIAHAGKRVLEIPIVFTERLHGRSKFNPRIMVETFWLLLRLRLRTARGKTT